MTTIEEFLTQRVRGELWATETILGFALLQHPVERNMVGVVAKYAPYLAVATNWRLIAYRSEASDLWGSGPNAQAKPIANHAHVWRYDELADVAIGKVSGLSMGGISLRLQPHPGMGPAHANGTTVGTRDYDIYPSVGNLGSQHHFHATFPNWLLTQFRSGAFVPSPERQAEFRARSEALSRDRESRERTEVERNALRKQEWQRALPHIVRGFVVLTMLGVAGFFASMSSDAARHVRTKEKYGRLLEDMEGTSAAERRENKEKKKASDEQVAIDRLAMQGWAAGSGLTLALLAGLVVIDLRRRKRGSAPVNRPQAHGQLVV